jgi:hypothetical protein
MAIDITKVLTVPVWPVYEDNTPILPEKRRCYMDRYHNRILADNTNLVRAMTLEEAETWITLHHNKIKYHYNEKNKIVSINIRNIRTAVKQRIKDIKSAITITEQFLNKEELIKQYVAELNAITTDVLQDRLRSVSRARDVNGSKNRNTLFDLPVIKMGLYSVDAYTTHKTNPTIPLTQEHCHPRTISAQRIFDYVVKNKQKNNEWKLTTHDILPELFKSCLIVWTTKAENKALEPFQKSSVFNSVAESYNSAGITVVDTGVGIQIPWQWVNLAKRYKLNFDSIKTPTFFDKITISQYELLQLGSNVV